MEWVQDSGRHWEFFPPHLSPGAISARSAGQSAPRIPGTHYEDESVLQLEGPLGFCFPSAGFFRRPHQALLLSSVGDRMAANVNVGLTVPDWRSEQH